MKYHASEMSIKQLVSLLTFSGNNHFSSKCRRRTKYSAHSFASKWQLFLLQAGWRRNRRVAGLWGVTSSVTGSSYHSLPLCLLAPFTGQQQSAISISAPCSPSLHKSSCEGPSTINIHTFWTNVSSWFVFFFSAELWNSEHKIPLKPMNSLWANREKAQPNRWIHPEHVCEAL